MLTTSLDTVAKKSGGDFQGILMSPNWVTDERLDLSLANKQFPNGTYVKPTELRTIALQLTIVVVLRARPMGRKFT